MFSIKVKFVTNGGKHLDRYRHLWKIEKKKRNDAFYHEKQLCKLSGSDKLFLIWFKCSIWFSISVPDRIIKLNFSPKATFYYNYNSLQKNTLPQKKYYNWREHHFWDLIMRIVIHLFYKENLTTKRVTLELKVFPLTVAFFLASSCMGHDFN